MTKSKGFIYGAMILIGLVSMVNGMFYAPRLPSALGFSLLGGINLIAGCVFLNHWHKVNYRQDGPYWVLEVMDDLGVWGLVSWSDIFTKGQVHCNMLIHHRSSSDIHFSLEDLTRHVNTLQERKVFDYIYHGYHMRMKHTHTGEVIPLEALGLDNSVSSEKKGGWRKIAWSMPV